MVRERKKTRSISATIVDTGCSFERETTINPFPRQANTFGVGGVKDYIFYVTFYSVDYLILRDVLDPCPQYRHYGYLLQLILQMEASNCRWHSCIHKIKLSHFSDLHIIIDLYLIHLHETPDSSKCNCNRQLIKTSWAVSRIQFIISYNI